MSDDLESRISYKLFKAYDAGRLANKFDDVGESKQIIAMFKQDCVEAIKAMKMTQYDDDDVFERGVANEFNEDMDDVIRTINQL